MSGATVAGSSSGTSGDGLSELCMPTGAKDRREGGVWRGGWFGWLVGKSPEIWERIKPSWGHQITGSDGLDGVFFFEHGGKKSKFLELPTPPQKKNTSLASSSVAAKCRRCFLQIHWTGEIWYHGCHG